jgi:hypothetical protein
MKAWRPSHWSSTQSQGYQLSSCKLHFDTEQSHEHQQFPDHTNTNHGLTLEQVACLPRIRQDEAGPVSHSSLPFLAAQLPKPLHKHPPEVCRDDAADPP